MSCYAKAEITHANYTSYFCSKYHPWFVEMGYPRLDILVYPDAEWAIIEYHTTPIIPCMTKHHIVLQGLRHIEISRSFCEKYVAQLDLEKKAIWDREAAKTKKIEDDAEAVEVHAEESAALATKAIIQNPDLMERIARKGFGEMDIDKIRTNIPSQRL